MDAKKLIWIISALIIIVDSIVVLVFLPDLGLYIIPPLILVIVAIGFAASKGWMSYKRVRVEITSEGMEEEVND